MKKFLAMILAGVLALSLAACGKSDKTSAGSSESDLEYVKNKGTLVVGITDFAPMDYKDDNGNWIGFDADMAAAFAESLGVKVEFVEITWDNKLMELKGKTIDCVWNGMTLTEDVVSAMECTKPYCNNQQIVIVKKENADKIKDKDSLKDLGWTYAVESKSAGNEVANELGLKVTEVTATVRDALMEVAGGTSDAAIIDSLMAAAMVGEGTSYREPYIYSRFERREIRRRLQKNGSDLAEELNKFFKASYDDGSMKTCAEKYGVQAALIEQ